MKWFNKGNLIQGINYRCIGKVKRENVNFLCNVEVNSYGKQLLFFGIKGGVGVIRGRKESCLMGVELQQRSRLVRVEFGIQGYLVVIGIMEGVVYGELERWRCGYCWRRFLNQRKQREKYFDFFFFYDVRFFVSFLLV